MVDISESNFELLLEEKRHKEIIEVLKKILVNLTTVNTLNTVKDTSSLELKLTSFMEKINLQKDNMKDIPSSIISIGESILKTLKSIEEAEKTNWFFKIERDSNFNISSVFAERTLNTNNITIKTKN